MKYYGKFDTDYDLIHGGQAKTIISNEISSGSIKTALDDKQNKINLTAGKLLKQGSSAGALAEVTKSDLTALGVEDASNKVTSLSASSTDTQYPSAKVTVDFVNSSVNSMAAHYITSDTSGNTFASHSALTDATTYYYNGVAFTPTEHDYAVVTTDEDHNDAQTRYSYTGSIWSFQYIINDEPFTSAQMSAINSGATASIINSVAGKQEAITATGVLKGVGSGSVNAANAADIPGVTYITDAPTSANTDGLKFVVLDEVPATKYDGYLYIITE